jgi:hypothetical protein
MTRATRTTVRTQVAGPTPAQAPIPAQALPKTDTLHKTAAHPAHPGPSTTSTHTDSTTNSNATANDETASADIIVGCTDAAACPVRTTGQPASVITTATTRPIPFRSAE